MQSGFIREWTTQYGVVIAVVADRQPTEPLRPVLIEVAFDANFIPVHLSPLYMCSALHLVCCSTKQISMYRKMCRRVDSCQSMNSGENDCQGRGMEFF